MTTIGILPSTGPQHHGLARRFAATGDAINRGSRSAGRAAAAEYDTGRIRGAGQADALTTNLIAVDRRYPAPVPTAVTGVP